MASFTFGAGNAAKVLRLPLYALGALATIVVPRTPRLWVIGSGIGIGEGALPFYRAARAALPETVRVVWLAGSSAELTAAIAAGLDAERRSGWRGFRLTLRARVLVVTHGFGDVNRFATRGGFVVQLWHGIPLKRLHLDSDATLRVSFLPDHRLVRTVLARAYRLAGRGISLFPVSSALVEPRIVSAFGVAPDRVVVTGDPRDDVLLAGTRAARRTSARTLLAGAIGTLPPGARVILSAPTWRDGAADPGVPSSADWDEIAAWLERTNAVLLVRTHPLGSGDYARGPARSDRIRMLGTDVLPEITPALPAVDALVTDYSSIAYDYSLVGGPIVFFAPDLEHYAQRRGLYLPYRAFAGGQQLGTWHDVLARLEAVAVPGSAAQLAAAAHTDWLRNEHFDVLDGRATERVLAETLQRSGVAAALGMTVADVRAPFTPRSRVTSITFNETSQPPGLSVTVQLDGRAVGTIRFDGARSQQFARADSGRSGSATTGSVTATFDLLSARWGAPGLAMPSGDYRLTLDGVGAEAGPGAGTDTDTGTGTGTNTDTGTTRLEVVGALPGELRHPLFRARVLALGGGLVLRVSAPLADDEVGAAAQKRLEREYRRSRPAPENAVFFESFYGQSSSDNPLGIDRALAESRPQTARYWSVVDGSVAVPDGAVRIIEGSRDWWRVRGAARVLVVNDWLRKRFRRRSQQHVLQTWHGTMLKRLGLDRNPGLRTRIAVTRESQRWDALLAQNPYSAEIFGSAYDMRRPIWQEGYPRNDVFADAARIPSVRRALGLPEGARVVLYAPTWRDDRTEMVDYVDLASFAGELGDDHVLLVRGHSRTLRYGQDLEAERLIDVTSYPNMADLLQVADVFVTDYSSAMFDVVGTDKPLIFFTPDLAHYSTDLRGFYFDLLAEAPGPVVRDRDGLLAAIRGADAAAPAFAAQRAAWRARFTPRDDGNAGARVVARLVSEGWLP